MHIGDRAKPAHRTISLFFLSFSLPFVSSEARRGCEERSISERSVGVRFRRLRVSPRAFVPLSRCTASPPASGFFLPWLFFVQ